jgi:integrase
VKVKEAFAAYLMHFKPGSRPNALDAINHSRMVNELAHLETFMGENTLQDLGYSTGVQYMEHETAQAIRSQASAHEDLSEVRYVARSTARRHVVTLVKVLDWYCGGENRIEPIRIKIPSVPRTAVDFLTIEEIVRLISAARGRIYDLHGNIVGHHGRRADYECVVRFILVYLYGGTRHANILFLTWGQDSFTGHIDPDLGIIARQGALAPITNKGRETSPLIGSLIELAERWRAEDEALRKQFPGRYVNIIHDAEGFPIAKKDPKHAMDAGKRMNILFREVRELAGLPHARPHMLKHSGVTYCVRAGMPVNDVENAFSTSFITLWTYYRSLRPWFRNGGSQPYDPSCLKLLALRRFSSDSKAKLLAKAA